MVLEQASSGIDTRHYMFLGASDTRGLGLSFTPLYK